MFAAYLVAYVVLSFLGIYLLGRYVNRPGREEVVIPEAACYPDLTEPTSTPH